MRIVGDTSALFAVIFGEPERDAVALASHEPLVSAGEFIRVSGA